MSGCGVGTVGVGHELQHLVGVADSRLAGQAGGVCEVLAAGRVQFHGQQHGRGGRLDCEAVAPVQDLGLQVACGGKYRHCAVEPVARQSLGLGYEPGSTNDYYFVGGTPSGMEDFLAALGKQLQKVVDAEVTDRPALTPTLDWSNYVYDDESERTEFRLVIPA